ncbi:putative rhoptry protein 2, partial [Cryptosporidium felis]
MDDSLDIISELKSNLKNDDLETCSLEKDVFQFGVLSLNPLLITSFWETFSRNYCRVASDSAFITWVMNKFTFTTHDRTGNFIMESRETNGNEFSEYHGKDEFGEESTNSASIITSTVSVTESISGDNRRDTSPDSATTGSGGTESGISWLTKPLPTYFDRVKPEIEVELFDSREERIVLPEIYEYKELVGFYERNDRGDESENEIKRRNFLRSNYFCMKNESKWVSFIVRNVPFRNSKKDTLEFKCGIGSWPYKGGDISWMGQYMCEVAFISSGLYRRMFDFSSYENYYKGTDGENEDDQNKAVNQDGSDISYFNRLNRNRMIGIEFETSYPHRCGIGYLGNESKKTLTSVKGSVLLKLSLGFCLMHGFTLQWLSDDSFNIYTDVLYKYTQSMEKGMTYYERNGFELSGSTEQRVYSNNTCSGVIIESTRGN